MAQQTALEQLEKKLKTYLSWSSFLEEDFEQAKQIEKEQMIHFAETMPTKKGITQEGEPYVQYDAEQHYKDTNENNS